ncbi:hypothetical protein [Pedobacter cryoconitis]|uniref:Uncharacterized protein n=1 Tax=Pedobacter cryoconitis TaxID=188932 RepID=A0A7X0IZU4_9SPHI|nr:hypothetical protein [Pedobacter cryoconitis]MBB6498475.1 hypothetical protein [Pedobacter cryoconitis]
MREIKTLCYPEDFRITTTATKIDVRSLLQEFVDAVSFYAFFSGQADQAGAVQVDIIWDCLLSDKGNAIKGVAMSDITRFYMSFFTALYYEEDLSDKEKLKRSRIIMRQWENEYAMVNDISSEIRLEDGSVLELSFDFKMVCKISGLLPEEILEYFMGCFRLKK